MEQATISRIQRFSTGDGPGIRTTVFLKGCNLHCAWCHNPETWSTAPELLVYASRCTGCGACARICPSGAHRFAQGTHQFERSRCTGCFACVDVCPSSALQREGRTMRADETVRVIAEDRDFYAASGGGATLSGGEPLLQPAFCAAVAAACHAQGISVLIDTAGDVPFDAFRQVLPYTDRFYVDLKGGDAGEVARLTGANLSRVLANMTQLVKEGAAVTARIPVIPGHTDRPETARRMASLLQETGVREVGLLPFHRLGAGKYAALGRPYPYAACTPPTRAAMEALAEAFSSFHVTMEG